MWRTRWHIALMSMLLATQTWPLYTAASPEGAKALFYTEAGTTVTPSSGGATKSPELVTAPLSPSGQNKPGAGSSRTQSRVNTVSRESRSREPWLGIAYWVEWERPGAAATRIADPSRFVFQSGDRIRFHVKTNLPGHLYVLNRGTSGRDTVLFPRAGMPDQVNRVEAQKEYAIPPRGWIVFDNQPGEEVLQFVISPSSLTNHLLEASLPGAALSPSASGRLIDAVDRRGAKDLIVETDNTPGQQATYLGAAIRPIATDPEASTVVTYMIRLQHQ